VVRIDGEKTKTAYRVRADHSHPLLSRGTRPPLALFWTHWIQRVSLWGREHRRKIKKKLKGKALSTAGRQAGGRLALTTHFLEVPDRRWPCFGYTGAQRISLWGSEKPTTTKPISTSCTVPAPSLMGHSPTYFQAVPVVPRGRPPWAVLSVLCKFWIHWVQRRSLR
jgi:hypothetical protein